MRAELQRYLDGELPFEDLPPDLRDEARAWDRELAEVGAASPAGAAAPDWIEEAVMAAVAVPRSQPGRDGWVGWLTRPREVRVSPLVGGLAAAAIAALMIVPRGGTAPDGGETTATLYVQFVMEAPMARSVAVAGDFNDWEARHELADPDGDGVWTGRIAVQPGIHEYMFVVDGDEWVTPPGAEGYRDDGFGSRNAVVTVLPSA